MDIMIKATSYGEIGIDTEASPGNGQFYAKTYDGELDSCGYDTAEEAWAELEYVACGIEDAEFDMVQDRKTGEWYDPKKAFDAMMNKPEIMASLKRLAIR
jgi:hypothetical protein